MATEIRLALSAIPMDGMAEGKAGEGKDAEKVLFVRDAAGVRAFQAKCPHLGAPLAKGEICGGRIYCPWHKAAFALADGSLEEPPALESLARYPVRIDGTDAVATLEPEAPSTAEERGRDAGPRDVLIVGTGAAAVACATTLRRKGFSGTITLVGREGHAPYDRTKLSKQFLAKPTPPEKTLLEPDFFAHHNLTRVHGTAKTIDPVAPTVVLEDGSTLTAAALVVATGSRSVTPDFPGTGLDGVATLRSLDDAVALSGRAEGAERVVVIGAGFIGLEAAAFLTKRGLQVTVLSREDVPFAKRFGPAVGEALKRYHAGNGIRFETGEVARIVGGGATTGVETKAGRTLPCDIVLIGAGAAPETGTLSGVALRDDGGVAVGGDLKVGEGTWLVGDIAAFPEAGSGVTARIEHWRLAQQHGAFAAEAILGSTAPFAGTPFFWSNQGDKRLDYVGYAPDFESIVMQGDPEALDFIAYYVRENRAVAACSIGRNAAVTAFLHLLGNGRVPTPDAIAAGADLPALARAAAAT